MDKIIQAFLLKIEKKITSPDAVKRVKGVHEIRSRMETSEDCIVFGIEHLIHLLKDPDPWVRRESLKAIVEIIASLVEELSQEKEYRVQYNGTFVPLKKLVFYQAIQLTKDPDPGIRLQSVNIAGEKSLEIPLICEKATPFLMARIRDEDKEVRNAAMEYIIKISHQHPELTRPLLMKLYKGKKKNADVYVTYILDKTMIKHHCPEFIPIFFDKLKDADINTEKYLISALSKCGIRDLKPLDPYLTKGLTDHSDILWWVTARNMMMILARVAEKHPENVRPYLRYLIPHLTSDNREIRLLATQTVGLIGTDSPDMVKEALSSLIDLVKDPDDKVKEAVLDSLDRIGIMPTDFGIVKEASQSLNEARLHVLKLKNENDLSDKIRESYILSRNAFADQDFERSLEYSELAIIGTRTRRSLRMHAREALRSTDLIMETASLEGLNIDAISRTLSRAEEAYKARKYFLAHELIFKSKMDAGIAGPSDPMSDPYEVDPGMEARIDTLVCHRCGERTSKGNTNCSGCGTSLASTSCSRCGSTVPQGFQFCAGCGERLEHVCEVCGAINEDSTSTCEVCGGHLNHGSDSTGSDMDFGVEIIPR